MSGGAGLLITALALAGCGSNPPPQTVAPPVVRVEAPTPGPVDEALMRIDPMTVLKSVDQTRACRKGTFLGNDVSYHMLHDLTCPRFGDDRTLGFLFTDAFEAAITATGATISGSTGRADGPQDPAMTEWDIEGDALAGKARVVLVDGPGNVTMLVTMDLAPR